MSAASEPNFDGVYYSPTPIPAPTDDLRPPMPPKTSPKRVAYDEPLATVKHRVEHLRQQQQAQARALVSAVEQLEHDVLAHVERRYVDESPLHVRATSNLDKAAVRRAVPAWYAPATGELERVDDIVDAHLESIAAFNDLMSRISSARKTLCNC